MVGSLLGGVSKHMEIMDCVFPASPQKTGQILGYFCSIFRGSSLTQ